MVFSSFFPSFYTLTFFLYLLIPSLYCPHLNFLCPDTHSPRCFCARQHRTMLILHIRILSSSPFVFWIPSIYLYRLLAPELSVFRGLLHLFVHVPYILLFHIHQPCGLFPSYIAMCLEKTAVYLHCSFPCMCFVVDFLRLSGFDQALWILSNERITMLKAIYLFIYLFILLY